MQDDGLKGLSSRCGTRPARPAEVTQWGNSLASEIISGQPIIVHHSEGQTGTPVPVLLRADMAVKKQMGSKSCLGCRLRQLMWYSQVKKLIKNRMQGFELHLGALTPSRGEQMVRTQLHDDKWVAEA